MPVPSMTVVASEAVVILKSGTCFVILFGVLFIVIVFIILLCTFLEDS